MDNDVTDQNEENPELTSLREENRRLYELVERLIASQEGEQAHRKAIETELQEMKSSLIEQASIDQDGDAVGGLPSNLGQDLEKLVEGLSESLEERLSAKIDGLETRIATLSETQSEPPAQSAGDPDEFANATWKLIAPLGEELERLSGRVADLSDRIAEPGDPGTGAENAETALAMTSSLEKLLEDLGQANDKLVTSAQDAIVREREEMREVLETRLSEVGKTMDELLARQDDTQSQTLTLLRGLVDSHIGRLTTEWASQIDGLRRAVDDLRLEQVSLLNPTSESLSDDTPAIADAQDAEQESEDASENVVAGSFPSFQQSSNAAEEKAADRDKTATMSPDLRREMQAMEVLSEPKESDEEPGTSEESEDALLTEPAEWRAETEDDDEAFDFSTNGVPAEKSKAGEDKAGGALSQSDSAETASVEGREIDLRAYKDLRLSSESAESEADADDGSSKASGKSYENAPAEASLTRFVRLIRARKRSTPS